MRTAGKPGAANAAVSIVPSGSAEAGETGKIIMKEAHKARSPPEKVVGKVQAADSPNFNMHDHTMLWKELDAKNPAKGYRCQGDN